MQQENLFELFGITEEEVAKGRKKREASKQKPSKPSDGKDKPQKRADTVYVLPVTIYGCGYSLTVSANETADLELENTDRIKQKKLMGLLKERFAGLAAFPFSLKQVGESKSELFIMMHLKKGAVETIDEEAKICYGDTEMYFPGGTLEEAKNTWCREHPEFQGCEMAFSKEKKVLHPFFTDNAAGKLYHTPIRIGIMQHSMNITEHMTAVKLEKLKEMYEREFPFYKDYTFFYSQEENVLIPVLKETNRSTKVEKVSLPIAVRTALTDIKYEPDDFNGVYEVSLEEIRQKLEQLYPEFSKERTIMEYDDRHFIIPILKSSTKGAVICSRSRDYALYVVEGCDGKTHRIEKTPIGEFAVCLSDVEEEPEFHFALPKIPGEFLERVMRFFIQNHLHEAACQIFYTKQEGYTLYYPRQRFTPVSVSFERNETMETEKTLVMDLHSHGNLPAFFSLQDNRDEKGTRLFLVAGNLSGSPQIRMRAGIIGRFTSLNVSDIFEEFTDRDSW